MKAELQATFDAGALVLHAADHRWVKLALERSPQGQAMVVSVVTHGLSDDANGRAVTGDGVWLRISRIGAACALHASDDGVRWDLVRHFAFSAPDGGLTAGFLAQSPTGEGCAATFDGLDFVARDPGRPPRRLLVTRPAQEDGSNASWRRAHAQATCRHTKRRR